MWPFRCAGSDGPGIAEALMHGSAGVGTQDAGQRSRQWGPFPTGAPCSHETIETIEAFRYE